MKKFISNKIWHLQRWNFLFIFVTIWQKCSKWNIEIVRTASAKFKSTSILMCDAISAKRNIKSVRNDARGLEAIFFRISISISFIFNIEFFIFFSWRKHFLKDFRSLTLRKMVQLYQFFVETITWIFSKVEK